MNMKWTACALLLTMSVVMAQQPLPNVSRIRPQDVSSMQQPKQPKPGKPVELPEPEVKVPDDNRVLVDSLKAVVFVPSPDAVSAEPTGQGVVIQDIPLLETDAFQARIEPYLGKAITWHSIGEMVKTTILYYRSHDRPVVDVIIPEQDITGGIVQLLVVEGRVGKVEVKGNKWFSSELIRSKVKLQPGDPIEAGQLLSDIDYINQNAFRYVRPVLAPGDELGQTDVILDTKDRLPYRPYVGWENTGSRTTGLQRFLAGVNMGNLWGLDHEAGFQVATNQHFSDIIVLSGYYRIPMPTRGTLAFFGSWAQYDARHAGLDVDGFSWQASMRYIHPLPTLWDAYSHEIQVGYDFKQTNNDLGYGGADVYDGVVDTSQLVLQYGGYWEDPLGSTSFTISQYWSPPICSERAEDNEYEKARPGTDPRYYYANLSAERIWNLPYEFTFVNRFIGQLSTNRLLGSEQMGFGGYNTVRGYDMREINADEGLIISAELRTPEWKVFAINNDPSLMNRLQFLVFYDYGQAHNIGNYPGEDANNTLSSVGVGLRYKIGTYLSFRMDWGYRLHRVTSDFSAKDRFHFGLVLAY